MPNVIVKTGMEQGQRAVMMVCVAALTGGKGGVLACQLLYNTNGEVNEQYNIKRNTKQEIER